MNVNNAFLQGDLDVEIYMKLPQRMLKSNDNRVYRLRKSLYGLIETSIVKLVCETQIQTYNFELPTGDTGSRASSHHQYLETRIDNPMIVERPVLVWGDSKMTLEQVDFSKSL